MSVWHGRIALLLALFVGACTASNDEAKKPVGVDGGGGSGGGAGGGGGGAGGDGGSGGSGGSFNPFADSDDDGVRNGTDNCPHAANHNQADGDGDGIGDVCDDCPATANADQADGDGDGKGDVCDNDDTDRDGVIDRNDDCPHAADPAQSDSDSDGIGDACDNCPGAANFSQADRDGDGIGDACEDPNDNDGDGVPNADDDCPDRADPDQQDEDNDGRGDRCDNCPATANFSQADEDHDGVGDACEMLDRDGDGVADGADDCVATRNPDQADADDDGVGDACDDCPNAADPDQADRDHDGRGDACTRLEGGDRDRDGVPDDRDNCPNAANRDQADADGDGVGDACDGVEPPPMPTDSDGDGVPDDRDNCPAAANPTQIDTDGDGPGDACDPPGEGTDVTINLSWQGATDLDLHVLDPSGVWFDATHDLHWANKAPAWGRPGLDADSQVPAHPETVHLHDPPRGRYLVGVFFFQVNSGAPAGTQAHATLDLTCNNRHIVAGPRALAHPMQSGPGDIWQAAWINVPDCTIDVVAGDDSLATGDCSGNACQSCERCLQGPCHGVQCGDSTCDTLSGECRDLCMGVSCAGGQACDPTDGRCYATGAGLCDPCQSDVQCTAESTTHCLINLRAPGEQFCSRPCGNGCPPDYDCIAIQGSAEQYCAPSRGTCVDRCHNVHCGAGLTCDVFTGQCRMPGCQHNADCGAAEWCGLQDHMCHPTGHGNTPVAGQCMSDAECVSGTLCSDFGTCAIVCDDQTQCGGIFPLCVPGQTDPNRQVCLSPF